MFLVASDDRHLHFLLFRKDRIRHFSTDKNRDRTIQRILPAKQDSGGEQNNNVKENRYRADRLPCPFADGNADKIQPS